MYIKFGNLTVQQFEDRTETLFTDSEREFLESYRTDMAESNASDKFHIFDDPGISIHIGSTALADTRDVWLAAQERAPLNQQVQFYGWDQ